MDNIGVARLEIVEGEPFPRVSISFVRGVLQEVPTLVEYPVKSRPNRGVRVYRTKKRRVVLRGIGG